MNIIQDYRCAIAKLFCRKQKIAETRLSKLFLLLVVLMAVFTGTSSVAQNLENIGKGKAIGLSGGINANTVFYGASGIDGRRDPFNYFLSGNLNISLYDWSVPLTFSYSNQQTSFHQPFNQYGLSPTYKWVTLHAGYRSMTFSNYTMNGHLFLGGGFDITPNEMLKVSAFYGRLQKAVKEDTIDTGNVPAYQRMGGGVKVTVGDQKNFVDMIMFKANDEQHSLENPPLKSDVDPEENLVLGFNFGALLLEKLALKGEFASSAISKDTRSEEALAGNMYDKIHFAFRPRASSSYYKALKGTLQYSFTNVGVGLAYERIDPGYRTLGAYYFNNNLESFAATTSAILFQKKARVNGQVGLQRNNLDRDELNTMNRISGAVNINYQVSPRLTYNLGYSNFQTVINFRSQFDYINQVNPYANMDTLNYRQIAQNANGSVNYVINESKERRQNISVNVAYQKTSDEQASVEQPTGANFYNLNSNYTIALGEKNLTLNVAANANVTKSMQADNTIFGPSASVRKTFFDKKLSTNATVSYNNSYLNGVKSSSVTNIRMGANYTWKEKHQFDLSLTQINRVSPQSSVQKKFNELTIQLGYNYNFSTE
jgi:hypothetical protein